MTGGHILYKSTFEGPLRKIDWNCRPQKRQILDKNQLSKAFQIHPDASF